MDKEKILGSGGGRAGKPPPYQAAVEDGGPRCRHGRVIGRKFRQTSTAGAPFRINPSFTHMPEKFSVPIPVRRLITLKQSKIAIWRTRRDSNPWPLPSEGSALSS